jgi:hypothetical protein
LVENAFFDEFARILGCKKRRDEGRNKAFYEGGKRDAYVSGKR